MNKNKDKITFLPLGAIPKKEGWDEFTVMYYADAHGYFFLDDTDPAAMQSLQYMKVLDMSLYQYIKEIYGVLRAIKEDWDESIGFNRQRRGQNMASDGKGVNEEAIFRSALVSEEFFTQHEETIVEDLNYLMSISKFAWNEGKKGVYSTSDFRKVEYFIDPTIYPYSDVNVYVKNSGKVKREVDSMKNLLGTLAQQTENFSILPKIAQATNMPKLIEQLEEIENNLAKRAEQENAAKQNELVAENENKEKDRQLKIYEIDTKTSTDKEIALINLQEKLYSATSDTNGDGKIDEKDAKDLALRREQFYRQIQKEREELAFNYKKLQSENERHSKQLANNLEVAAKKARQAKKVS